MSNGRSQSLITSPNVKTPLLPSDRVTDLPDMPPPTRPRRTATSQQSQHLKLPPLSELPQHLTALGYKAVEVFFNLSLKAKILLSLLGLIYVLLVIVVLRLGTHGILEYLAGFALFFSQSSFGPLILLFIITILSFPPTVGYGTSITLCGLAYGSPASGPGHGLFRGWLIAAIGCVVGSVTAFLTCRRGLHSYANHWEWVKKIREGREWKAMERAVERKGWKMVILIRFCPFPFVYSNLFFASLRPHIVPLPVFILATLLTTPKLALHVYIGGKAFDAIQAGRGAGSAEHNGWISFIYIGLASLLGMATSWWIYRETRKTLDQFIEEAEEEEGLRNGEEGDHDDAQEEYHLDDSVASLPRPDQRNADRHLHADSQQPPDSQQQETWGWSDDEDAERPKRSSSLAGIGNASSLQIWAVDISAWPKSRSYESQLRPVVQRLFETGPGKIDEVNVEKVMRYLREVDRTRALAALLLPRVMLLSHQADLGLSDLSWSDLDFGRTREGRPFLQSPKLPCHLDFNISHDGDWVVMAYKFDKAASATIEASSLPRVGIDVMSLILPHYEESPTTFLETMGETTTEREAQWVREASQSSSSGPSEALLRLYDLWTYKEALTKNLGLGLGFDFKRIQMAFWDCQETSNRSKREAVATKPVLVMDGEQESKYTFTEVKLACGTANTDRKQREAGSQLVVCQGPLSSDKGRKQISPAVEMDRAIKEGLLRLWDFEDLLGEAQRLQQS